MLQPKYVSLAIASVLVFSGVCLPIAAMAQEQEPVLEEVNVQADKLQPAAMSSAVSTDNLQQMRAATSDTASLLANTPGVSLYSAGGVSSLPVIHGLADDRLRIKVDGMDLIASCPNHMNPPLSYLDPASVGTLTTYAGITPVSVGGDSIGGTIIAETRELVFAANGEDLLTQGEMGAFYRSNGNVRGGNIAVAAASEHINLSYTGSSVQSDNYKAADDFKTSTATGRLGHTLPHDEVGSSAYESINQTLGLALKGGNHLLDTQLSFQKVPEQLYPNQRMDMLENEQKSINTRYEGQFNWGELEAQVYEEQVEPHHMDFGDDKRVWYSMMMPVGMPCSPIGPGCAYGMPMDTESTNTGINLKADINLDDRNLLRVGGLYQEYSLDDWWEPSGGMMGPGVFVNINNGQRDRAGLFSEWESRINPEWLTLLGVRYEAVNMNAGDVQGYEDTNGMMMMPSNQRADAAAFNAEDHERTDDNWDLTALTRYTPDTNADIEFGVSRKTRSPNLYERYTWSTWGMASIMNNFVGDGNGYVGNIDLDPEVANTVSATFDFHSTDRQWEIKATPFYSRVDDYIDAVRCTSGAACTPMNQIARDQFVVLKYENQEAELYGVDLSGRMPLASTAAGDFGLQGLVNYTHGENRDTDDDLYNVMPLNATISLTHKLGRWDSSISLMGVEEKDDISGARNEIKTPGYSVTNLRTSYSWDQVRVDVGVDNVFDKMYYEPLGGAYVGQGTTMGINSIPWGVGVPGMGRSVYAGVTYKF
jgi:iron complex outermembrane receptor protein